MGLFLVKYIFDPSGIAARSQKKVHEKCGVSGKLARLGGGVATGQEGSFEAVDQIISGAAGSTHTAPIRRVGSTR